MLQKLWSRWVLVLCCVALPAWSLAASGVASAPPKLVVMLVVDGLPQRQVLQVRGHLLPDGLARFLDQGTWFSEAHYGHSFTVTAAGHATLLTGTYPQRSGIIGNDWRDPVTGAMRYCTEDSSASYIGHATRPLDGTSPRNLRVDTVGDALRQGAPSSRVIAVSGKDRGAILLAGHKGTAYMYMQGTGLFASSTYYMAQHPAWVEAFNAGRPADKYVNTPWQPILPASSYPQAAVSAEAQSWFPTGPQSLPMRFGDPSQPLGPRYYSDLVRSPFVDAMSLDFALAARAAEGLGQGEGTDILAVSLSGHDYVNHAYSAESMLSYDHLLQLDRLLQKFFRALDAQLGAGNYLAALSADHGFMPAPQYSAALGRDAQRLSPSLVLGLLSEKLEAKFGPGKWLAGYSGTGLLLNTALVAEKGADRRALAQETALLLRAVPGIEAAYTAEELIANATPQAPHFAAMRKSYSPHVPLDVLFALKPWWMFSSYASGTTHGSPHEPDTHVPLMLYGPKWVAAARVDSRVETVDLAPTLARLLGIDGPATMQGKALPLPAMPGAAARP